jgi:hypothetical protein
VRAIGVETEKSLRARESRGNEGGGEGREKRRAILSVEEER